MPATQSWHLLVQLPQQCFFSSVTSSQLAASTARIASDNGNNPLFTRYLYLNQRGTPSIRLQKNKLVCMIDRQAWHENTPADKN